MIAKRKRIVASDVYPVDILSELPNKCCSSLKRPLMQTEQVRRQQAHLEKRRRRGPHGDDLCLLVAWWTNMGFGVRVLSYISIMFLAQLCRIRKVIFLDVPSKYAPGRFSEVFDIPRHLKARIYTDIEFISDPEQVGAKVAEANDNEAYFAISAFMHPQLIAKYAESFLSQMKDVRINPMPMSILVYRTLRLHQTIEKNIGDQLQWQLDQMQPNKKEQPHILKVGLYLRGSDMVPLLKHNLQLSPRAIREIWHGQIMKAVDWAREADPARGCLILAASDDAALRKRIVAARAWLPPTSKISFVCTCPVNTNRPGDTVNPTCNQCSEGAFVRVQDRLRETGMTEWAEDMLWISKADRLIGVEWSSACDVIRMLKGQRFEQAIGNEQMESRRARP